VGDQTRVPAVFSTRYLKLARGLARRPYASAGRALGFSAGQRAACPRGGPSRRGGEGEGTVDVSHVVEHGMVTYQGLPAPLICDYLSRAASRTRYAPGTEFQIGRIDMVANTGTYVDSPFHRYADGRDLAELPLESLAALPCLVARIEPGPGPAIDALPFAARDVRGKAVLVHTGWPALAATSTSNPPPLSGAAKARARRCWSASTRSTWTTSRAASGRCTRRCSRRASRSWST
jgi:hypothetical protein